MQLEGITGGFLEEVRLLSLNLIITASLCTQSWLDPCALCEGRVDVCGVLPGIPSIPY